MKIPAVSRELKKKKKVPRPAGGSAHSCRDMTAGGLQRLQRSMDDKGQLHEAGTGVPQPWAVRVSLAASPLGAENSKSPDCALQKRAADAGSVSWRSHQDPSVEASGRLWTLESSVRIPTQQRAHLHAPWTLDHINTLSGSRVSRHKRGIQNSEVRGEAARSSDISPGLSQDSCTWKAHEETFLSGRNPLMTSADVSLEVGKLPGSQSLFQNAAFPKLFSSLPGSRFGKSHLFLCFPL